MRITNQAVEFKLLGDPSLRYSCFSLHPREMYPGCEHPRETQIVPLVPDWLYGVAFIIIRFICHPKIAHQKRPCTELKEKPHTTDYSFYKIHF